MFGTHIKKVVKANNVAASNLKISSYSPHVPVARNAYKLPDNIKPTVAEDNVCGLLIYRKILKPITQNVKKTIKFHTNSLYVDKIQDTRITNAGANNTNNKFFNLFIGIKI